MNLEVQGFNNSNFIEKFAKFLKKELQIDKGNISIYPMEEEVHLQSRANGLCIDSSEDDFILLIYENKRSIDKVFNTIAHEMIHVKQFIKENLNHYLDTCLDIPYDERWWEKEAKTESWNLVLKYVDYLNENN